MKKRKILRWLVIVFGSLLLLVVLAIVFLDPILKAVTRSRIQKQLGLQTTIAEMKVQFGSGSLQLRGLKLFNPREFGGTVFLDIPEISLQLDPIQARAGKLCFKQIRFHLNELHLVKDRRGRLNLQAIEKNLSSNTNSSSGGGHGGKSFEFGGIEKLYLTLGKLRYTDLSDAGNNEEIDFEVQNELVQNLRTEEEFKQWGGAFCVRLFLQVVTQQMINGPDRAQSFGEVLKKIDRAMPEY